MGSQIIFIQNDYIIYNVTLTFSFCTRSSTILWSFTPTSSISAMSFILFCTDTCISSTDWTINSSSWDFCICKININNVYDLLICNTHSFGWSSIQKFTRICNNNSPVAGRLMCVSSHTLNKGVCYNVDIQPQDPASCTVYTSSRSVVEPRILLENLDIKEEN